MQAVVRIGKSQYLVSPGDKILVDKGLGIENTLLVVDGDKVVVGQPEVTGVKVVTKTVTERLLGKKVRVAKYKAKSRYRKTRGFRPAYSLLEVQRIDLREK